MSTAVRERTRRWVREAVVGLGLCPFARDPVEAGKVRIAVEPSAAREACEAAVIREANALLGGDRFETTLVVLPEAPADFVEFLELVRELELNWEGALQVLAFHPRFVFGDAPLDDPAHATNRAPYPTVHLLREASVTAVIDAHPDPDAIWRRNVRKMRALDDEAREALYSTK